MSKTIMEEIEKLAKEVQKSVPEKLAEKLAYETQGLCDTESISRQILNEYGRLDLWLLVEKIHELPSCIAVKYYLNNLHNVVSVKTP